jgi:hypothetical protein
MARRGVGRCRHPTFFAENGAPSSLYPRYPTITRPGLRRAFLPVTTSCSAIALKLGESALYAGTRSQRKKWAPFLGGSIQNAGARSPRAALISSWRQTSKAHVSQSQTIRATSRITWRQWRKPVELVTGRDDSSGVTTALCAGYGWGWRRRNRARKRTPALAKDAGAMNQRRHRAIREGFHPLRETLAT